MGLASLTDKQLQVYCYLKSFFAENDQLPTMRFISEHFGWSSENSALIHMKALERKGVIEKNVAGRYRFKR